VARQTCTGKMGATGAREFNSLALSRPARGCCRLCRTATASWLIASICSDAQATCLTLCIIALVSQMFQTLYGQTAAALYAKAAGQNAQARQLYNASADTYYKANDAAAYDDWVRARNHWDYFYNRS